ncbi:MAG: MarR family transcriptional regulator [Myxococcales bacterium]|nr:MarR family transcriptional regulator [Myxococcales bacterium]
MKPAARPAAVVSAFSRRLRDLERGTLEQRLPRGLTTGDARVLRAVERVGSLGVSAIAAHLGTSQPAATVAIARLVDRSLVTVTAHSGDARRKVLVLSAKGRQIEASLGEAEAAIAEALLAILPRSARAAAVDLLAALVPKS